MSWDSVPESSGKIKVPVGLPLSASCPFPFIPLLSYCLGCSAWRGSSHLGTMRGEPENAISAKESRAKGRRMIGIFILGLIMLYKNKNTYILYFSFNICFWPHLWHLEVSGPGIKSPSHSCDLCYNSGKAGSLNHSAQREFPILIMSLEPPGSTQT